MNRRDALKTMMVMPLIAAPDMLHATSGITKSDPVGGFWGLVRVIYADPRCVISYFAAKEMTINCFARKAFQELPELKSAIFAKIDLFLGTETFCRKTEEDFKTNLYSRKPKSFNFDRNPEITWIKDTVRKPHQDAYGWIVQQHSTKTGWPDCHPRTERPANFLS